VTKKEIVKQIADSIEGMTQLKAKDIVQKTFIAIIDTLISERRIELRNFGVFEVKQRKARKARNPRTGEKVDVPPKFVVTFKPGKEMEERVRQLEEIEGLREALAVAASNGKGVSTKPIVEEPKLKVVRPEEPEPVAKPRRPRKTTRRE
jgi:nucleoid DNA-binding protein